MVVQPLQYLLWCTNHLLITVPRKTARQRKFMKPIRSVALQRVVPPRRVAKQMDIVTPKKLLKSRMIMAPKSPVVQRRAVTHRQIRVKVTYPCSQRVPGERPRRTAAPMWEVLTGEGEVPKLRLPLLQHWNATKSTTALLPYWRQATGLSSASWDHDPAWPVSWSHDPHSTVPGLSTRWPSKQASPATALTVVAVFGHRRLQPSKCVCPSPARLLPREVILSTLWHHLSVSGLVTWGKVIQSTGGWPPCISMPTSQLRPGGNPFWLVFTSRAIRYHNNVWATIHHQVTWLCLLVWKTIMLLYQACYSEYTWTSVAANGSNFCTSEH